MRSLDNLGVNMAGPRSLRRRTRRIVCSIVAVRVCHVLRRGSTKSTETADGARSLLLLGLFIACLGKIQLKPGKPKSPVGHCSPGVVTVHLVWRNSNCFYKLNSRILLLLSRIQRIGPGLLEMLWRRVLNDMHGRHRLSQQPTWLLCVSHY
jgi:hypothetical protein